MSITIKPTKGRVLIEKPVEEVLTSSGIELVKSAKTTQNTTTSRGTIVAVGEGVDLTPGAVLFDEGWGNEVEPGLYLVKEEAVIAYLG